MKDRKQTNRNRTESGSRAGIISRSRRKHQLMKMLVALGCIVVFVTSYALILPAITQEAQVYCGQEEHVHTEECYERTQICGMEEHVHTEECLLAEGGCPLEEHLHDENCYEDVLICERTEHIHADDCFVDPNAGTEPEAVEEPVPEETAEPAQEPSAEEMTEEASGSGQEETEQPENPEETEQPETPEETKQPETQEETKQSETQKETKQPEATEENGQPEPTAAPEKQPEQEKKEEETKETVSGQTEEEKTQDPAKAATEPEKTEENAEEDQTIRNLVYDGTTRDGQICRIIVSYGKDAKIPDGSTLHVREITPDLPEYEELFRQTEEAIRPDDGSVISNTRYFDITIISDDLEVEPAAPVTVRILLSEEFAEAEDPTILHFTQENAEVLESAVQPAETEDGQTAENDKEVVFETDSFSVYGVVTTQIEKTVLASDGHNYRITVSCGPEAGIPDGAELEVREIVQQVEASDEATEYELYISDSMDALGMDTDLFEYARFFDISIVKDGQEIAPADGASVDVSIELADKSDGIEPRVIHFGEETEVLEAGTEGNTVSFTTTGFSVYAVVDAPPPVQTTGYEKVTDMSDLASQIALGKGFYIRHVDGYYFTNNISQVDANRSGIAKTAKATTPDLAGEAAVYYFEPADSSSNKYRIYCFADDDETRQYVVNWNQQTSTLTNNSLGLTDDPDSATVFNVGQFPNLAKGFRVWNASNGFYWNMRSGTNGNEFCAYSNANDSNARLNIEYKVEVEQDPYHLDGVTYCFGYQNKEISVAGLTAADKTVGSAHRLAGVRMTIRPDVVDHEGNYLVSPENTDLAEWTFTSVTADKYYITTQVDNVTKYLTIDGASVILQDEPDPVKSLITVTPGTGSNKGKFHLTANGYSLNLPDGKADNGFNGVTGSGATTWLNAMVKDPELTNDDFVEYTANKVSVSDTEAVPDGQQVVLYTRIWNDTTKKYEFFVVDRDGTLLPCYESGGTISWVGNKFKSAVWAFTEYHYAGTQTPNYYYELCNLETGQYIAPQITGGQILSSGTIGVNLNGRRFGKDYTTIVAWDDRNYKYAGLKTENGHVVSCRLDEAEDFYFAILTDPSVSSDTPTETPTIDSEEYGVTMNIVNFSNELDENRDSVQTAFFGEYDNNSAGLLKPWLEDDGYPMTSQATTGHEDSLHALFYENEVQGSTNNIQVKRNVNHLFLSGTYSESGYFEYDSTQNFSHLNADGTFTVYDQLAAIGTSTGKSRTHGQFMPYNDLVAGAFAPDSVTNLTDVMGNELSDLDPRKGERLYMIPQDSADYFFGMELNASFTQTESGLDAWGHDIVFEFSGDDDFWLYVDGQLVLDLGGVHSASSGRVNFRTGVVELHVRDSKGNTVAARTKTTTLYDLFKESYKARYPEKTDAEVDAYLSEIFKSYVDDDGVTRFVFTDFSTHDMKVFYMERGASASNLHMRFNLASVKPGTVVLSKKLIDENNKPLEDTKVEFPYQVYCTTVDNPYEYRTMALETSASGAYNVVYSGTKNPVKFKNSHTLTTGTTYENVFFLKAGESAVIDFPEDTVDYYIVECGINPDAYDHVYVNGEEITGTPKPDGRLDYAIEEDTTDNRATVEYANRVKPAAVRTLTFSKKLYSEDGTTELTYDSDDPATTDKTLFAFRLYLGSEDDPSPTATYLRNYLIKDENGNYCVWDEPQQKFISLYKTDYSQLTDDEIRDATFVTSPSGSITKVPAGYSVEVRDLVVGTQYMVEERNGEVPDGFHWGSYERIRGVVEEEAETPNAGIIYPVTEVEDDPWVQVTNYRGWGLRINKVWSDADFMSSHDPIYVAVFLEEQNGDLTLLPGSVRQMKPDPITQKDLTTRYWYYDTLESGYRFDQYVLREVTISNQDPVVDDDGYVADPGTVQWIGEDGTLTVCATTMADGVRKEYTYSVNYERGDPSGPVDNVRVDTVTNSRTGIRIMKTLMDGTTPLAGVTFTLKDEYGQDVGVESFTSDENGLVTIAYLPNGKFYLEEIETPRTYQGLSAPVEIEIINGGQTINVNGAAADSGLYVFERPADDMPVLTVKNRTFTLQLKKIAIDDDTEIPLAGVRFELRPGRISGDDYVPDYHAVEGYGDLISDETGMIAFEVNGASGEQVELSSLDPGTYFLIEKLPAPEGYAPLAGPIRFTIGKNGIVTAPSGTDHDLVTNIENDVVTYLLKVINAKAKFKVRVKKVDITNPLQSKLAGAVFDLYETEDGVRKATPLYTGLVSNGDGCLEDGSHNTVFELLIGVYHLVETSPPEGYYQRNDTVIITVTSSGVTYDEGTYISDSGQGLSYDETNKIYTLLVSNTSGTEFPATGGMGTTPFTMAGLILALGAGTLLVCRSRKGKRGGGRT